MGGAGAAVLAIGFLLVALLGLGLTVVAWLGARGATSRATTWSRYLLPVGMGVLALGVALPKSVLRDLAFETTGRALMLVAAVVGAACASVALGRRERGALRLLVAHVGFGLLAATPLGEALFALFAMM